MRAHTPPRLSRRRFLAAAGASAAGAVVLGACADGPSTADDTTTTTAAKPSKGYALAPLLSRDLAVVPALQATRIAFTVVDRDGLLPTKDAPASLPVTLVNERGETLAGPINVARRAKELPRPYYVIAPTFPTPGIYEARSTVGGEAVSFSLQVFDAAEVEVIKPGDTLPSFATPTVAAPQGVKPICTRTPVCPLHDTSLDAALAAGTSIALLVSTPAFCQVDICGPVLEVLLPRVERFPGVRFIHAEVYNDPEKGITGPDVLTPAMTKLHLPGEPTLVLAGPDGQVTARLDSIYDGAELDAALGPLAAGGG